ncbi:MAG: MoaD/ThiS family protein [Chlorobi bacterium]|nr:MoaD/ThiS family protein [Chlorobiota bacterium]
METAQQVEVLFTDSLRLRFPALKDGRYSGANLLELLNAIEREHPRFISYILDDQQAVRKHVAVAIDGNVLRRSVASDVSLKGVSTVHIWQALSGG